jgi:hypothetical protein
MAPIASKTLRAGERRVHPEGQGYLLQKLGKLLHFKALSARGDDPVCMSALDATTLGRYGYNEREISLMKEGSLR